MRPLPVSCFVVSFSYWTCQMSAVWCRVFRFDFEVWATKTSQNTTREKRCSPRKSSISSRSCLGSLEQHLFFRIALRHDCYVLPLALTLCRHSAQGMAKDLACWPTVLSGCMSACENVCDIRANGAYAYQCWDSFLGAISVPYTSFVSCAFFTIILCYYLFWNTTINEHIRWDA